MVDDLGHPGGGGFMDGEIFLSLAAPRRVWRLPVLWEDEYLLALAKPPMPAFNASGVGGLGPDLIRLLHQGIGEGVAWARRRRLGFLAAVHRLDRDVSGVVLLVKHRGVLGPLKEQFGSEQPNREYEVLVEGSPAADRFVARSALRKCPERPDLARVDLRRGKKSVTRFEVTERFRGYALLTAHPLTEREGQVRAHLRALRLPVVGDLDYGGRPLLLSRLKAAYRAKPGQAERPLVDGAALHLGRLSFRHPASGAAMSLAAPLPKGIEVALKYLRRFAGVLDAG